MGKKLESQKKKKSHHFLPQNFISHLNLYKMDILAIFNNLPSFTQFYCLLKQLQILDKTSFDFLCTFWCIAGIAGDF